ncbi:hypothetical protein NDU88_007196 [Pleurodeles waltl]|uniref:Uncharacterized protein n=1 Tax=Pleurodeles waltl TaxID=8319 RepID=A0AAV7LUP3_PLEWA|nr:hypothetical protein NDU88_007196 [Pleurodeles waltl]
MLLLRGSYRFLSALTLQEDRGQAAVRGQISRTLRCPARPGAVRLANGDCEVSHLPFICCRALCLALLELPSSMLGLAGAAPSGALCLALLELPSSMLGLAGAGPRSMLGLAGAAELAHALCLTLLELPSWPTLYA